MKPYMSTNMYCGMEEEEAPVEQGQEAILVVSEYDPSASLTKAKAAAASSAQKKKKTLAIVPDKKDIVVEENLGMMRRADSHLSSSQAQGRGNDMPLESNDDTFKEDEDTIGRSTFVSSSNSTKSKGSWLNLYHPFLLFLSGGMIGGVLVGLGVYKWAANSNIAMKNQSTITKSVDNPGFILINSGGGITISGLQYTLPANVSVEGTLTGPAITLIDGAVLDCGGYSVTANKDNQVSAGIKLMSDGTKLVNCPSVEGFIDGVLIEGAGVTIENSSFSANDYGVRGSAATAGGSLDLKDVIASKNEVGVSVSGWEVVTMNNVQARENISAKAGIGIYSADAAVECTIHLQDVTASSNGGGGIYVEGGVEEANTTITIMNVDASENAGTGIRIDPVLLAYGGDERNTIHLQDVTASHNGADGISVYPDDCVGYSIVKEFTIMNVDASENGGYGISITTFSDGTIHLQGVTASKNGVDGITASNANEVTMMKVDASENGGHGIVAQSSLLITEPFYRGTIHLQDVTASKNDGPGIWAYDANEVAIMKVDASENGGHGIIARTFSCVTEPLFRGTIHLQDVIASKNDGAGIEASDARKIAISKKVDANENGEEGFNVSTPSTSVDVDGTLTANENVVGIRTSGTFNLVKGSVKACGNTSYDVAKDSSGWFNQQGGRYVCEKVDSAGGSGNNPNCKPCTSSKSRKLGGA